MKPSSRLFRPFRLPRFLATASVLGFAAALALADPARALVREGAVPEFDGPVYAQVRLGDTLYVGGAFHSAGRVRVGGFAVLDPVTLEARSDWPQVDGTVYACAADGAGGWFVGGAFPSVSGVPRQNLAHVRADGSLDGWNPGTNGAVRALALAGGRLYLGGSFTTVAGTPRGHLAALDAGSGALLDWSAPTDQVVYSLAASAGRVFAGGAFTSVAGQSRPYAAVLDATSGDLLPGPARTPVAPVLALLVHGGAIVTASGFPGSATFGGDVAAFDAASGASLWNSEPTDAAVECLADRGNVVYAGGYFTEFGLVRRQEVAAFDATSGALLPWSPPARIGEVGALAVIGNVLYEGITGDETPAAGGALQVRAFDATTGAPLAATPLATDPYALTHCLAVSGGRLFLGGSQSYSWAARRGGLAAIDLRSGTLLPWNPGANRDVYALTALGSAIYAGGAFDSIGGEARHFIAAIDAAGGVVQYWNPSADNAVNALATDGTRVWAGGGFTRMGNQPHVGLAAIQAETGAVFFWNPAADGPVRSLAYHAGTLYAGGDFTTLGGQARAHVAAIDPAQFTMRAWNPGADGSVYALAATDAAVFAGGAFHTFADGTWPGLAAANPATGALLTVFPSVDGVVRALSLAGSRLVVGGGFQHVGIFAHRDVASLNAASGAIDAWDPGLIGGDPWTGAPSVFSLAARDSGDVWVGGLQLVALCGIPERTLLRVRDAVAAPATPVALDGPAPGPTVAIGSAVLVRWQPGTSACGPRSVDLLLSRNGAAGPWETVAAGITGRTHYDWAVTGPATADARVRVVEREWDGSQSAAETGPIAIAASPLGIAPGAAPQAFALESPAPNPARDGASIAFTLPRASAARVAVFDLAGREVAVLAEGPRAAGRHVVALDARALRPGMYVVRLSAPGARAQRKLLLVH